MSASDPPSSDPLVGQIVGRHELLRLLGEGGMGAVYEATHAELGRRAAVKILHQRYARSAEVRQRFLREGQAASRVQHPNVVDVYDVGIEGSRPYLIMEFLEGEELAVLLAREGVLSAERSADLLLPVVAALAAAHDLGVIHRDLKPENIFLVRDRNGIRPKILDFGISKLVDRQEQTQLTGTDAFLGTPQYMSPEQARGARDVQHHSDQYSLGVILYLCVTGRRPVEDAALFELMQRIVNGQFPPPRQLNQDLPAAFEAVILRAMALDPGGRFATTRELGRALLEFASEQVRVQYSRELVVDPLAVTDGRAAPPEGPRPPIAARLGTTLGESVHQRELPGAPKPLPRRLAPAALASALLVAVAAWRWSRPETPAEPPLPRDASAAARAQTLPEELPHEPAPSAPPLPLSEGAKPASPAPSAVPSAAPSIEPSPRAAARRRSLRKSASDVHDLGDLPGLAPR